MLLLSSTTTIAHEKHTAGRFHLEIGWGEEPAFTGYKNSVTVSVADASGKTALDPGGAALSVEVLFGDQHVVLPLRPVWGRPGEFRAWLIPTRPGTYTFHVTGKIKDQPIDVRSTCSEKTFDCVSDASELHFPVKDPSAEQLAESVSRALPRAERAASAASTATRMAIAALAVAVVALAAAVVLGTRRSAKGA